MVLEQLGYKILNPKSDAPVYFLQHQESEDVVLIDKNPDRFPEDYIVEKINPTIMKFSVFKFLYERSKEGKKQHIKRKEEWIISKRRRKI